MSTVDSNKNKVLLERRFSARAKELCGTRDAVRSCIQSCGCSRETVEGIVLAIDEACQNIIRHAYRGETDEEIVLGIEREGNTLVFSLTDHAPEVPPDCMKPRALDDVRPGGLGCHFINEVMDEVSLGRPASGRGNVLRMVKRITT